MHSRTLDFSLTSPFITVWRDTLLNIEISDTKTFYWNHRQKMRFRALIITNYFFRMQMHIKWILGYFSEILNFPATFRRSPFFDMFSNSNKLKSEILQNSLMFCSWRQIWVLLISENMKRKMKRQNNKIKK